MNNFYQRMTLGGKETIGAGIKKILWEDTLTMTDTLKKSATINFINNTVYINTFSSIERSHCRSMIFSKYSPVKTANLSKFLE